MNNELGIRDIKMNNEKCKMNNELGILIDNRY